MPYIGPNPAESFTSFATQEFSTSATTSYTLDHAVTNENEIALFVNNVDNNLDLVKHILLQARR